MSSLMNIEITVDNKKIKIDPKKFQKMVFLFNALNDGWTIKKNNEQNNQIDNDTDKDKDKDKDNDTFILKKKHENKKEILNDDYLTIFMKDKLNFNNII